MSGNFAARVKKRKGFLPALLLGVLLFLGWLLMLFFLPPQNIFFTVLFLSLLFLSLLFLTSLIFANTRRGLLFSAGMVIFLVLGYWGAGTWLNLVLLGGILFAIELYFHTKS